MEAPLKNSRMTKVWIPADHAQVWANACKSCRHRDTARSLCFRSKTDSPRRPSTKGKFIRLTTACMAGTNSILRALLFLGFRGPDWHWRLHLRLRPGVLLGLPGLELLEQGFLLGIRLHFCTRGRLPQELLKPVARDGLDPGLIEPLL